VVSSATPEFCYFDPKEENKLAKNRYGWQKRAKELARKQKNEDKMKRRQGKAAEPVRDELPAGEDGL
jgi:hypothetical protein